MAFSGIATFAKSPLATDLASLDADVAVLGVPWDWSVGFRPGARFAPQAIRQMSMRYAHDPERGYFDVERERRLLRGVRIADCGDADVLYLDPEHTYGDVTRRVAQVLERGALPVVIGGDHSITYPVVRAFGGRGDLYILQLDAHVDFKDEVLGVKYSNSSPFRRIAEQGLAAGITTVGVRGLRTSEDDYQAALRNGNRIVLARDYHRHGPGTVLPGLPPGARYYLSLDIDGLDPSIAPGTGSPEPEGLSYTELKELVSTVADRGEVVGLDLVEVNPYFDPTGLTSLVAARTIMECLGAIDALATIIRRR